MAKILAKNPRRVKRAKKITAGKTPTVKIAEKAAYDSG